MIYGSDAWDSIGFEPIDGELFRRKSRGGPEAETAEHTSTGTDDSRSGPNRGPDDDDILGSDTNDVIRGGRGNDVVHCGDGDDDVDGEDDDDLIYGNTGNDKLRGGGGADDLFCGRGADLAYGNVGDDAVYGNLDDDTLLGGSGDDSVFGGQGNDLLLGNTGNDLLFGGLGADTFDFDQASGADIIRGFSGGEGDRIHLHGQSYSLADDGHGGTLLLLSGGGTVDLEGISAASLTSDIFK